MFLALDCTPVRGQLGPVKAALLHCKGAYLYHPDYPAADNNCARARDKSEYCDSR